MFQVCLHGRGGQGVVTASEFLAHAFFHEGFQVQATPSFGSERTGAPVVAYCRVDEDHIFTREPIVVPDAVIVQDPTLIRAINPFEGMEADGWAVVNTTLSPDGVREVNPSAPSAPGHLSTVPADEIVRQIMHQNKPSGAMMGAFAALTGKLKLDTVLDVITARFKGKVGQINVDSAKVSYAWVKEYAGQESYGTGVDAPEIVSEFIAKTLGADNVYTEQKEPVNA